MPYFAHSTSLQDQADWQALALHLNAVARLARERAEVFWAGELGAIMGLLHDVGKYTQEFQDKLRGESIQVDHATRGAMLAVERYGMPGYFLAYGVAGHHSGLANGLEGGERRGLKERLRGLGLPSLDAAWEKEIALPGVFPYRPKWEKSMGGPLFTAAFFARMLYSCLVDADYLDTEAYYEGVEAPGQGAGRGALRGLASPGLTDLRQRLEAHLAGLPTEGEVNRLRRHILEAVRAKAPERRGLFSLTVPTGGGKTLASLAFALDHALQHGLRRVIYVIPYTSIIEQTARVFRAALGDLGERAVLEHHSAFAPPKLTREEAERYQTQAKLRLAMETWDAPIVVTTAVQFFESLFAARPGPCRKLHNIAGSVVILDEAQTLPLKLLRPAVAAVDELARHYPCSVVLCTATQPALQAPELVGELGPIQELAPEPERLFRSLERVRVRHGGSLSDADLTADLTAHEQVLCIVNNRRHARALFQSIAHLPGARHLTTLMCARHRSQVLEEIRADLKAGRACRLVSTSLIEAGVDVDFPRVLRAEAGLDAIAQAAGRCNREGKRPREESEVLVFVSTNPDWQAPVALQQCAGAARTVLSGQSGAAYPDPLAPEAIAAYFRELYWQKGAAALDGGNEPVLGALKGAQLDSLPLETLAQRFRMIDSVQMPVIIPWDEEAKAAIKSLAWVKGCGQVARALQGYLVQVPRQGFDALCRTGAVQAIEPERWGEQFMALTVMDLYDSRYGLSWDDPSFLSGERTCW